MSTISSMTNNTYMMYKFAASTSAEASGTTDSTTQSLASMKALVSSMSGTTSGTSSSLWGSTSSSNSSSLWSAYSNAASEAASTLSTVTGMKNTISNIMSSYESTKKIFNTEFKSTMSDLKNSAQTVKNMSYNFSSDDITTINGSAKYSESLTSAIKSVKNLVSDYNDALSFLSDNSSVSKRVKRLSTTFSDTTYRVGVYSSVGITVDSSTGKLSLDESKLADALVNNSNTAEYVLGKNGLAGKAESHVAAASSQSSQLFPSASGMLGDIQGYSSLYSSNTLNSMNKYLGIGNLVNMYF